MPSGLSWAIFVLSLRDAYGLDGSGPFAFVPEALAQILVGGVGATIASSPTLRRCRCAREDASECRRGWPARGFPSLPYPGVRPRLGLRACPGLFSCCPSGTLMGE